MPPLGAVAAAALRLLAPHRAVPRILCRLHLLFFYFSFFILVHFLSFYFSFFFLLIHFFFVILPRDGSRISISSSSSGIGNTRRFRIFLSVPFLSVPFRCPSLPNRDLALTINNRRCRVSIRQSTTSSRRIYGAASSDIATAAGGCWRLRRREQQQQLHTRAR